MSAIKRLQLVLLAVLALNAIGMIGYNLIEGWPWLDCLYMTFITLATIGFGEVHPLSSAGRIFTMLLFWPTTGLLAFAISTSTQVLIQSELVKLIGGKRKMFKDIAKLKDHYIVCGAGPLVGKRLRDTEIRRELDTAIIAIKRSSGEMHFNPSGDAEIRAGDLFIAVGSEANSRKLARLANPKVT